MARDDRGHWLPGRSANPGGRPGVPETIKAKLRQLSPRAVDRLGQNCWIARTNASSLRRREQVSTGAWADRRSRQTSASIAASRTITLRHCLRWRGRGEPRRLAWTSGRSATSRRPGQGANSSFHGWRRRRFWIVVMADPRRQQT
jgi:hypothetical protein